MQNRTRIWTQLEHKLPAGMREKFVNTLRRLVSLSVKSYMGIPVASACSGTEAFAATLDALMSKHDLPQVSCVHTLIHIINPPFISQFCLPTPLMWYFSWTTSSYQPSHVNSVVLTGVSLNTVTVNVIHHPPDHWTG